MDKEKRFKLTGRNSAIDFSSDSGYIIISGYDGSFKILDVVQ